MQTALVQDRIASAGGELSIPSKPQPMPHLPFRLSRFLTGREWVPVVRSSNKVQCRARASTAVVPKKKDNLLAEAERRFLRATETRPDDISFSKDAFAALLHKYDYSCAVGDTVVGTVFMTERMGALVDIGDKAPAFLPLEEASMISLRSVEQVGLVRGVKRDFYILSEDDCNSRMIVSLRKLQINLAWERCKTLHEEEAPVKGLVMGSNRGGVLVTVEGLRGFVPSSQMAMRVNFEDLQDKVIPLKIIEVKEDQDRLILSHRMAIMEQQSSSIGFGTVVEGVVHTVRPFGAFINFQGLSGLLHISEISHARVSDVEAVLQPGDKLKVMVLSQDHKRGKINLSTKKLEPMPGDMLKNPQSVYDSAELMASKFLERRLKIEAATANDEQCTFNLGDSQ